jgi:hypothetical protein
VKGILPIFQHFQVEDNFYFMSKAYSSKEEKHLYQLEECHLC